MEINVTQELKNLAGNPLKNRDQTILLRDVCINALLDGQEDCEAEEKIRKYALAMQIYKEDKVNIVSEDTALIKKCVGKYYKPLIVGQSFEMLEGK